MQSCSRSSFGRWSMEVLMGNMERGFFFFNKFKSGNAHRQTHTVTYKNVPTPDFINTFKLKLFNKV